MIELPDELARFELPAVVQARLQLLLDRPDAGERLSAEERREAEGLVESVEFLSLIQLRATPIRRSA
jgi:ribosome assembly protein YihI (activator of Der GTPase)